MSPVISQGRAAWKNEASFPAQRWVREALQGDVICLSLLLQGQLHTQFTVELIWPRLHSLQMAAHTSVSVVCWEQDPCVLVPPAQAELQRKQQSFAG